MRRHSALAILTAGAAAAAALHGAEAGKNADDPAKAVAPFIDEETVVVVRIDARRIDVDAAFKTFAQALAAQKDSPEKAGLLRWLSALRRCPADLLHAFLLHGGQDAYLIVSIADLPRSPVFAVFSLQSRALSTQGLVEFIRGEGAQPDTGPATRRVQPGVLPVKPEVTVALAKVVFAGSRKTLERIKQMKPAHRPEVARAFAAASDAAVQVLILPTADSRRVIEEMMPTLPEEFGGGPSTAVTRGVLWAAIAFDPPPKMSLRVRIQSQDAASARALRGVIQQTFAGLAKDEDVRRLLPKVEKLLAALTPKVEGDHLTLAVDGEQAQAILEQTLVPAALSAGRQARRTASMRNISRILRAIQLHVAEHNGQFPKDLQTLVQAGAVKAAVLINPRDPHRRPGYVYLPPTPSVPTNPATLIVYEAHDDWPGDVCAGFVDGSVRAFRDRRRFQELLSETRAKAPPAPPQSRPTPRE